MNIFVLDLDPKTCASYHCDKHVVKMIVETAQLLSTAHHVNGTFLGDIYKKTHENHPCAIWARKSKENYDWLASLGIELCLEYERRYGREHKTTDLMATLRDIYPSGFPQEGFTKFALCMPEKYWSSDVVNSYREYYKNEKRSILIYKNREKPNWI